MTTGREVRRWPSLLTVEEAAEMVDHNPQTIRALIRNGELRARRSGGAYVLAREDLVVDIARHRHKVAEEYRARGERRRTRHGA